MIDPQQLGEIFADEWNKYPEPIDQDIREAITCIVNRISAYGFDAESEKWSRAFAIAFVDAAFDLNHVNEVVINYGINITNAAEYLYPPGWKPKSKTFPIEFHNPDPSQIWLLTIQEYKDLPDGAVLYRINGERAVKGIDEIDTCTAPNNEFIIYGVKESQLQSTDLKKN